MIRVDTLFNSDILSKRIPEVDGLRGIAILGVLIAHFQPSFANISGMGGTDPYRAGRGIYTARSDRVIGPASNK